MSPKLGDACRPGSVSLPSSLLGEQTCPRGQGRDHPQSPGSPGIRLSYAVPSLPLTPTGLPKGSGRAGPAAPLVTEGRLPPREGRSRPSATTSGTTQWGASGTSSPGCLQCVAAGSTSRREHGHHGRLGTQSVSPSLSSPLTEVKYSKVYWTSLVAQMVKCLPAMRETWFDPWVGKIPWRRE